MTAIATLAITTSHAAIVTNWAAYNDFTPNYVPAAGWFTHSNATAIDMRVAGSTGNLLILLVTLWDLAVVPALTASVRDIAILHFALALLAAKFVELFSALREIFKLPPSALVSSGWFFAFAVTLQPLFLFSFLMWALG